MRTKYFWIPGRKALWKILFFELLCLTAENFLCLTASKNEKLVKLRCTYVRATMFFKNSMEFFLWQHNHAQCVCLCLCVSLHRIFQCLLWCMDIATLCCVMAFRSVLCVCLCLCVCSCCLVILARARDREHCKCNSFINVCSRVCDECAFPFPHFTRKDNVWNAKMMLMNSSRERASPNLFSLSRCYEKSFKKDVPTQLDITISHMTMDIAFAMHARRKRWKCEQLCGV